MSSGVPTAYPTTAPARVYTAPPPPVGYPTATDPSPNPQTAPETTQARGDGFWKGCCAALCCCCALEACF
ncbi:hypothetical protein K1719_040981 [Acacia pycnantha]|nr:hypothetical protein K1719_040981 [Acacia pycnantha]